MLERSSFFIQAIIFLSYIPITFIAYRLLREPKKRRRASWELSLVAEKGTEEYKQALSTAIYELKEYIIPLTYITLALAALYAMTHPIIIQTRVWYGLLETNVGLFNDLGPDSADVIYGRFLYWGWLGAYIYSVERTIRHYLANDLSPSVYIAATKRFVIAFVVGAILAVGFSVLSDINISSTAEQGRLLGSDTRLVLVYLVTFITGLFPERGMRWLVATAGKALGQSRTEREHRALTEIDGISYWHRGRLEDEGVENVQNLANSHLLTLIVKTPYDVGQVVDWTDQAILLSYATNTQIDALANIGLRRASDVLTIADQNAQMLSAVTGLSLEQIQTLKIGLERAANIRPISRYRRLSATAPEPTIAADASAPLDLEPASMDVVLEPSDITPASPPLPS